MTRAEYLERVFQPLRKPGYGVVYLEFKPFSGWWLRHEEPVCFGDEGEYLGRNWRIAEDRLRRVFG